MSPLSLFQKEIQTFKCIKCFFFKNDEIMTGCRGAGNGIIRQSPRVPLPYPDAFAYERCVSLNRNKTDIISGFNSFEFFFFKNCVTGPCNSLDCNDSFACDLHTI